jgi:hypothetical protein
LDSLRGSSRLATPVKKYILAHDCFSLFCYRNLDAFYLLDV